MTTRSTVRVLRAVGLAALLPAGLLAQTPDLRLGRTVPGTLAAGDTARYTLTAGNDSFVFGEVNQISVAVTVRILDAAGRQVGRFAGPGRGANRFAGPVEKAGAYQVQVIPADGQAGAYAITLLRLEPVAKDPKRLADQLMAQYDGPASPGALVHVWRDGKVLFSKAYGMANLAYGIPYTTGTPTNIGSTSKQFTAFAIMLQAQRGRLSLDDDIRKHIPELPAFDHPITVRHVITHTSGLREFLNLLVMSGRRLDHGDWIDRHELIDIVQRQPRLQNVPGTEWNYNNTAFGLAALIVERTSGKDFPTFMREEVFGPLGMTHTMVRPSIRHQVPGGSEGYTPGPDGFLQIGDLGGAVGAGGIYTTVGDLQTWVANYANPRLGTPAMIKEMMTSYVLANGKETGYGYGLFIDKQRGLRRVHHGGADVAHRSMLAYYPDINAGITVQSNHAGFNSNVAFQLAAAFFGDAMEPEKPAAAAAVAFDAASYDPKTFDRYVGRYALEASPDFVLTFSRRGDSLFAQATGQPRLTIAPQSDSSFALTVANASVVFRRDAAGKVTGLVLKQGGQDLAARRLEGAAPDWKPSAADLAAFAGRYFSEELETFYTIAVNADTLVVRQRRLDEAKLTPGEPDRFAGGGLNFAFERDRNGKVIGFYVANGRTRDVRFERVGGY
ncbi:MAG: serine hydrolase [Gemmatimonadales bacterium]